MSDLTPMPSGPGRPTHARSALGTRAITSALLWVLGEFTAHSAEGNWASYLGDPARSHYSALKQIQARNVRRLEVAWTFRSGDARADNLSQIQCNPLVIDGVLYATTPACKLVALEAATGRELWRFDPAAGGAGVNTGGVNRGVVCWGEGGERRIVYSVDHFLYAIEAGTGRPVASFGRQGRVDIKDGLGRDVSKLFVSSTSPGAVFENLLVLPMRVGEGPAPAAPGHLRAYDLRTGGIVWTFHTIPYPGEPGYETWPPDA
jgi:quinoprotein glucose dehydrogenase